MRYLDAMVTVVSLGILVASDITVVLRMRLVRQMLTNQCLAFRREALGAGVTARIRQTVYNLGAIGSLRQKNIHETHRSYKA